MSNPERNFVSHEVDENGNELDLKYVEFDGVKQDRQQLGEKVLDTIGEEKNKTSSETRKKAAIIISAIALSAAALILGKEADSNRSNQPKQEWEESVGRYISNDPTLNEKTMRLNYSEDGSEIRFESNISNTSYVLVDNNNDTLAESGNATKLGIGGGNSDFANERGLSIGEAVAMLDNIINNSTNRSS